MTTTGQHHVVVDPETSPVRATLIVATMCLAATVRSVVEVEQARSPWLPPHR